MIAVLSLLLQAAPPPDWSALPQLPVAARDRGEFDPSPFVRGEVEARRCAAEQVGGGAQVVSTVALLVVDGAVRRIVPQAINCPSVEQFTVGYVSTLVRHARVTDQLAPGWYRYVVTYRWAG